MLSMLYISRVMVYLKLVYWESRMPYVFVILFHYFKITMTILSSRSIILGSHSHIVVTISICK